MVYKKIICTNSDLFKTACSGQWKEASERLVRLPEADSHIFGVYLGWLYTGNLDFSATEEQKPIPAYESGVSGPEFRKATKQIMDTYVLGDMLQDAQFCNTLVDEFMQLMEGTELVPSPAETESFWSKLPQQSTMCKLLVDYIAAEIDFETFLSYVNTYPAELVKEVAKVGVRDRDMLITERAPARRGKCFYHEHKEGSRKCA